jgi:hypothetical protein
MKKLALFSSGLIAAATILMPMASAHHRPTHGCSKSGDICVDARKVYGVRKLKITTAAHYFTNYRLCVTAPDKSVACHMFQVQKAAMGSYKDSVRWALHFPNKGIGPYTVRWKNSGSTVGTAGFHVR